MNQESTTQPGMSSIVKTVTHWILPLIFLYGIYQVLFGHAAPGGGFAGGVVITCGFILLTLADGKHVVLRRFSERYVTLLTVSGILLFAGLAVAGLLFGTAFFESFINPNPHDQHGLFSAVFILIGEIAIALLVSMALFLVFSALLRSWKQGSDV